jgi:hypothetical protein
MTTTSIPRKTGPSDRRKRVQLGPYSRALRRGSIRDSIDGRSNVGRFIRDLEAQLISHVGGHPTITQQLLIDRLVRCTIQLDQLDDKLLGKNWTDLDSRTYGGLINRQRLLAREIGLTVPEPRGKRKSPPPAPQPAPNLADIIADMQRREAG